MEDIRIEENIEAVQGALRRDRLRILKCSRRAPLRVRNPARAEGVSAERVHHLKTLAERAGRFEAGRPVDRLPDRGCPETPVHAAALALLRRSLKNDERVKKDRAVVKSVNRNRDRPPEVGPPAAPSRGRLRVTRVAPHPRLRRSVETPQRGMAREDARTADRWTPFPFPWIRRTSRYRFPAAASRYSSTTETTSRGRTCAGRGLLHRTTCGGGSAAGPDPPEPAPSGCARP